MTVLMKTYRDRIIPKLVQEFQLSTPAAVPSVKKVVINMGIGNAKDSREEQEKILAELAAISGQKPILRNAHKAVAGFGIRQGQPVGAMVTLRGKRMYDFLYKLFNIVLPRIRDFKGVPRDSFDKDANYTLGITEHTVFPEIDLGTISKTRGLEVTIITSTRDQVMAARLLEEMGMPFKREEADTGGKPTKNPAQKERR